MSILVLDGGWRMEDGGWRMGLGLELACFLGVTQARQAELRYYLPNTSIAAYLLLHT